VSGRVTVPSEVAAKVLFESDRTCCVCRERGQPVQVHHIDENPSNNATENLAVLCILCHWQTQLRGGFDRKLDAPQVLLYRDDWISTVQKRRSESPSRTETPPAPLPSGGSPFRRGTFMLNYIRALPGQRRAAYAAAQEGWDSGVTANMMNASYGLIHGLRQFLAGLAAFYPKGHFAAVPDEYFAQVEQSLFTWHRAHYEPDGAGTGGTMIGPLACGGVTADLERMVVMMVRSLALDEREFDFTAWMKEWRR
jgi:hypothetical protein